MLNTIIIEANKFISSADYNSSIDSIGKKFSLDGNALGYLFGIAAGVVLGSSSEDDLFDNLMDSGEFKEEVAAGLVEEVKERILNPFKNKISQILRGSSKFEVIDNSSSQFGSRNSVPIEPVEDVSSSVDQSAATSPSSPATHSELITTNPPVLLAPAEPVDETPISSTATFRDAPVSLPGQMPAHVFQPQVSPASSIQFSQQPAVSRPAQAPLPRKEESLLKADILDGIENPPRTVIKRYVLEHEPITDPDHLIDNKIDNVTKLQDHCND